MSPEQGLFPIRCLQLEHEADTSVALRTQLEEERSKRSQLKQLKACGCL